jgi:hypothetical protein
LKSKRSQASVPRSKTKENTNAFDSRQSRNKTEKNSVFDFVWENKSSLLESQKDKQSIISDLKEKQALNQLTQETLSKIDPNAVIKPKFESVRDKDSRKSSKQRALESLIIKPVKQIQMIEPNEDATVALSQASFNQRGEHKGPKLAIKKNSLFDNSVGGTNGSLLARTTGIKHRQYNFVQRLKSMKGFAKDAGYLPQLPNFNHFGQE